MLASPALRPADLLLLSVRLTGREAAVKEAERLLTEETPDWEKILESARLHCVRPQLERLLGRIGQPLVPAVVMERLREATRENLLRQLRNAAEFYRIKDILDNEGITAIPFKGLWLAEQFYNDIAGRESYDVDIFIDASDIDTIKKIMEAEGYLNTLPEKELRKEYILNDLCEINFDKYEGETRIQHFEFHWRSSLRFFEMNITLNDLRESLIRETVQGKDTLLFSPAAHLLLTVMHHGGKEQMAQLKQAADIAFIISKAGNVDWDWLIKAARRYRLETVLLTSVRLAGMVTGISLPPETATGIRSAKVRRLAEERYKLLFKDVSLWKSFRFETGGWLYRIRSRDGVLLKIMLLWHYLRRVLAPYLVPVRWHHHFYNRKIRIRDGQE